MKFEDLERFKDVTRVLLGPGGVDTRLTKALTNTTLSTKLR